MAKAQRQLVDIPDLAQGRDRGMEDWTEEEEDVLRRFYRRRGSLELAPLLGRTPGAIRNQAYKLGYTAGPREEWNRFEQSYLEKNYPARTAIAIARTLGRTEQAVRARIHSMGLGGPGPKRWTAKETEYLVANYEKKTIVEIAGKLGRSEDAVSLKAAQLGIRKKSAHVEPKGAALRYIIDNLGVVPYTELARKARTSVNVVRRIAAENGYRARPLSRAWTDADEARLRKLWGTMSPEEVAEQLNRHVWGVAARASALGLRRRPDRD